MPTPAQLSATVPLVLALATRAGAEPPQRWPLRTGWMLQSSAKLAENGKTLSKPGFKTEGWHAVTVPNTVVGALVENGHFPDPYFGMNLRSIPGTTYPIGERFTLLPMPADSPFKPSWWYRREFDIPASPPGRSFALHFDGINYRAAIWVNGTRIASPDEVVGVFRRYDFDVSRLLRPGVPNAVAVEVMAPEPDDLSIMWVDWNPTPPDKNMGLWGEVYLTDSGPIALRHPQVVSTLDVPSLETARLTVTAEAWNTTDEPVRGIVRGAIEAIQFEKALSLRPRERTTLRFTPDEVRPLVLSKPRVWWPYRMGAQELYTLALDVDVGGSISDRQEVRFGIQQMTSELTDQGHRLFRVNGKRILIRGGGWASDMMLRPASTARLEAELRYTKEMGLNTIRLEGKLETDEFYDLADREGMLVMPGWCCCDQWELWDKWDAEDHRVAPLQLRDQILRLRNHPSVLAWMNGSDFPPIAGVEKTYLDVLESLGWTKPVLSNATDAPGPVSGPSGVKMRGPYDYVPPSYWLTDKEKGGAFGFATEIGPGAAVPPLESLKQMLPPEHLWPIDEFWRFHAGGDEFKDLKLFTEALEGRYGRAKDVADYARKAQALAYEGQRAMFEGYARNKYTSTGVIQWMLNNAWPSMIWHLYDYFLRPGGGYFGTKKAGEPLHVQYSYDDRSVVVVNDLQRDFKDLKVTAEVVDFDLRPRLSREARLDIAADSVVRTLVIPDFKDLTTTYFLRLKLEDSAGKPASANFYWLSTQEDVLDWKGTKWYYTPTKQHADLRALATLPPTTLVVRIHNEATGDETRRGAGLRSDFAAPKSDPSGLADRSGVTPAELRGGFGGVRRSTPPPEGAAWVSVQNVGRSLAFQVRLKLLEETSGREVLPVFWDDNYFELFPGETREIRVAYPTGHAGAGLTVEADAWNAASERSGE